MGGVDKKPSQCLSPAGGGVGQERGGDPKLAKRWAILGCSWTCFANFLTLHFGPLLAIFGQKNVDFGSFLALLPIFRQITGDVGLFVAILQNVSRC